MWLFKKLSSILLNRNITVKLNYFMDNFIPPVIRDNKILMYPLFFLIFKEKTPLLFSFKEKSPFLTEDDFVKYYEMVGGIKRETDLNSKCITYILDSIIGNNVLDVGCGNGFLISTISKNNPTLNLYGLDIQVVERKEGNISFIKGFVEQIPFEDNMFDTVICTHTLEHVLDLDKALSELRRVAKKRLIIVIPCQRPYRYTPDLHLNFFPYEYSLYLQLKLNRDRTHITKIDGDFLIIEDL